MTHADCSNESPHSIGGPLLSDSGPSMYRVSDRDVDVVMAAKCVTFPGAEEIRAVHISNGDVNFRESTARLLSLGEDW